MSLTQDKYFEDLGLMWELFRKTNNKFKLMRIRRIYKVNFRQYNVSLQMS